MCGRSAQTATSVPRRYPRIDRVTMRFVLERFRQPSLLSIDDPTLNHVTRHRPCRRGHPVLHHRRTTRMRKFKGPCRRRGCLGRRSCRVQRRTLCSAIHAQRHSRRDLAASSPGATSGGTSAAVVPAASSRAVTSPAERRRPTFIRCIPSHRTDCPHTRDFWVFPGDFP